MKKFDLLIDAIKDQDFGTSYELANELYNLVRDFSQSIEIEISEGKETIKPSSYRSVSNVSELKDKVREWVGGR